MKLAWICYRGDNTVIVFEYPEYGWYDKVVPIVYAEIEE